MPISISNNASDPPVHLCSWMISDQEELASLIAHLVLGRIAHVERILHTLAVEIPWYRDDQITKAIARLDGGGVKNAPKRTHRDGWLFQFISWIVLHKDNPALLIAYPQRRKADKGFDGLALSCVNGAVEWLMITEDKASENPKSVMKGVWRDFKSLEEGNRDDEITAETEIILKANGIDPASITANPDWLPSMRYRASVATSRSKVGVAEDIFMEYETIVPSGVDRRYGNLFLHDDLRDELESISSRVQLRLDSMRP